MKRVLSLALVLPLLAACATTTTGPATTQPMTIADIDKSAPIGTVANPRRADAASEKCMAEAGLPEFPGYVNYPMNGQQFEVFNACLNRGS